MKHLPLFFDLRGRAVLLVGGGSVALRKARFFGEAGSRLTVIAPQVAETLRELPGMTVHERPAEVSDLDGDWSLVILATNRPELQEMLARECRSRRIPVNRCDDPEGSDFITGSIVDRPPFLVAINSGGSPTLSRLIRKRLEDVLEPALSQLADLLNELRPEIKRRISDPSAREALFRAWGSEEGLARLKKDGVDSVRQAILDAI